MWRRELWHPLLAHFPIALLTLGSLFWIGARVFRRTCPSYLLPSARLLLGVGVASAWLSIFLGEQAESVVNRVICDPTVTQVHHDWAWRAGIGFSAAFVMDLMIARLKLLTALILLSSLGALTYSAHLGASLVYQQGAAVYHPTPECTEFE